MTGMRNLAKGLGLIQSTPPERIVAHVENEMPRLLGRIPERRRQATIELLHWAYGAGGGAAFSLLPAGLRRQSWSGPAYGVLAWAGFATMLQPLLALPAGHGDARDKAVFLVDHLLYGVVVAGRLRPPVE